MSDWSGSLAGVGFLHRAHRALSYIRILTNIFSLPHISQNEHILLGFDIWPFDLMVRCSLTHWFQKATWQVCTTILAVLIQTKNNLTSDNFAHEGRTGSTDGSFWSQGTFEIRIWPRKFKSPKKLIQVTRGQPEVKGHPDAGWLLDPNSITPNLGKHFVLALLPKYYLIDLCWPQITWPLCLKIIPYTVHT